MEFIKMEQSGHVAIVTISRPAALNALSSALLAELQEAFKTISENEAIRAVILTGEGKAFVAGADISEMKDFSPEEALCYAARGAAVFAAIEALPQPVIAAVNGFALGGGCELALSCDLRIASEKAKFGQPETGLGITPGFAGTQRLPRAVGTGYAMQMILTGKVIDSAEALRVGLVNSVYPADALMAEAMRLAEAIADNAPAAVRAAKRAIREGLELPLPQGIAREGQLFAACFATQDQRNAMAAFVEKRKPDAFTGK